MPSSSLQLSMYYKNHNNPTQTTMNNNNNLNNWQSQNSKHQSNFIFVESENYNESLRVSMDFLYDGLKKEEDVVLVCFEPPEKLIEKIKNKNKDFINYLEEGNFYLLYYKNDFTKRINLSMDYADLFYEIKLLSSKNIKRVAFLNSELLFNTDSSNLITLSASKLLRASEKSGLIVMAKYVNPDKKSNNFMDICKTIFSYHSFVERKLIRG